MAVPGSLSPRAVAHTASSYCNLASCDISCTTYCSVLRTCRSMPHCCSIIYHYRQDGPHCHMARLAAGVDFDVDDGFSALCYTAEFMVTCFPSLNQVRSSPASSRRSCFGRIWKFEHGQRTQFAATSCLLVHGVYVSAGKISGEFGKLPLPPDLYLGFSGA